MLPPRPRPRCRNRAPVFNDPRNAYTTDPISDRRPLFFSRLIWCPSRSEDRTYICKRLQQAYRSPPPVTSFFPISRVCSRSYSSLTLLRPTPFISGTARLQQPSWRFFSLPCLALDGRPGRGVRRAGRRKLRQQQRRREREMGATGRRRRRREAGRARPVPRPAAGLLRQGGADGRCVSGERAEARDGGGEVRAEGRAEESMPENVCYNVVGIDRCVCCGAFRCMNVSGWIHKRAVALFERKA